MRYLTNINDINKEKTLLLIDASVQAYAAFSTENPAECQTAKITPPTGYDFIDYWTGVDSIFSRDKTVECYGVVFRSQAMPHTYIFAFRGTSSWLDTLDDLGMKSKPFKPHALLSSVKIPAAVAVESGFYDVYSESEEDNGTVSMQKQLFSLIDKYQASDKPVNQLYITGHSLGAALSELFTLDLALSRPEIFASNYNYACPRVGNSEFVDFYTQQPNQQNIETRTLRIQNTYDKVPCVPPKNMGYRHIPDAFIVEFYEESWSGLEKYNLFARHSSSNYQAVLNCAAQSENGLCIAEKLEVPANDYAVTSKKPNQNNI
ncbi:MAG: lipase family protein, partial [Candidatus Electrothrix sp. AR5]|nr:lipase family protein [Candidatus Electrothrix sp. AR5]